MRDGWQEGDGTASPRVGEVVETASHKYTAQCYRLYQSPALGAIVRTQSARGPDGDDRQHPIYAVVYLVSTQAIDPGRLVLARGEGEANEDDVYRNNPQLERLLCTRFEAQIVGYDDGPTTFQYLPAHPPRIHSFVYPCTGEEVGRFASALDFLDLLVDSSPAGRAITDEVIAACLRQASRHSGDPYSYLLRAGKSLAVRLAEDLPRLSSVLKRLSP